MALNYFGVEYFAAYYFNQLYVGGGATFSSDTLGAGAGHRKRPNWPEPELYFPPVKDPAEIEAERARRVALLKNIKHRKEKVLRAEESRRLLAILKGTGRFNKRFEAAIDLLGGRFEVTSQAGADDISKFLAGLLREDEESEYEREVPRSVIAKHMADLWIEDPERFEQFWNRMRN